MTDLTAHREELLEHLENHLGPAERNFHVTPQLHVARYRAPESDPSGPVANTTVGLSAHALLGPNGGWLRQELLMVGHVELDETLLPSVLAWMAELAIERHWAVAPGDLIPLGARLTGSAMEALYVATPVCYPDELGVYEDAEGTVLLAWLIPITASEADFIRSSGGDAFEALLLQHQPDLFDIFRDPVPLP